MKNKMPAQDNLRRLIHLRCFLLSIIFGAFLFQTARAQPLSDESLKKIEFQQKLGSHISLDLEFKDEDGKVICLNDYFHQRPVILVLGYYRCPMLCSYVLNGMIGSLQDLPGQVGDQFDVINVSIDPSETPSLAAAKKKSYVKRYGRAESAAGWHFLTGREAAIRRLADEVGFTYAYDAEIKQYAHPSGLIILTPDGRVSQYLSGVVYSRELLSAALAAAAAKKVGSPLQQLFLLCFHYSPISGKYGWLALTLVRITGILTLLLLGKMIYGAIKKERASTTTG